MPTIPEQIFNGKQIPRTVYYSLPLSYANRISNGELCTIGSDDSTTRIFIIYADNTFNNILWQVCAASMTYGAHVFNATGPGININCTTAVTIGDKTAYIGQAYQSIGTDSFTPLIDSDNYYQNYGNNKNEVSWLMLYGGYDGYTVTYDLQNCVGDSGNPQVIAPSAVVTNFTFSPDTDYMFNSGSVYIDGSGFEGSPIEYTWNPETGALKVGVVTSDIVIHAHAYTDPYNDPDNPNLIDGESDIPGGDTISVPGLPGISAVSSGVIGLFNPSTQQMKALSDFMWTDFGGTATTTDDILKEIAQAIKRTISNPLDYIIGLNIIPSQGLSVGSSANVRFGFVSSGVSMPRLLSQYFVVDCGTLSFDKLCGDTFLDYAPYSKFTLYLPYIGVKEMDANDFVGHTIGIVYHGDVVTGGITAYVLKDGSVMYQYAGCCALTVPINADSWGNVISGAVQIATSIVAGGVVAGGAGATIATAKGAADVASNPSMLSPQVLRSGAVSGGAGCMAVQKPFVIREAVRFHSTNGFNTISGYPSYYYKTLSEMHGFTSVLDVHLHGIPATDGEIAEIESLLKEGVIL